MNKWVGTLATTLAAAAFAAGAGGAAIAQDSKGYYTQEQADHGKALFDANCAQCHGQNLEGIEAPGLAGPDVMGNWATAQGMYDYFSVAMPPTAPGKLGDDNYVDIMAYILKVNGAPAGDAALTKDALPSVDLVAATAQAAPAQPAAGAAATPAPAADAGATKVPQSFTWGKQLPTVGGADSGQAAPAQPAQPKVPQSYTWGKDLPTVSK